MPFGFAASFHCERGGWFTPTPPNVNGAAVSAWRVLIMRVSSAITPDCIQKPVELSGISGLQPSRRAGFNIGMAGNLPERYVVNIKKLGWNPAGLLDDDLRLAGFGGGFLQIFKRCQIISVAAGLILYLNQKISERIFVIFDSMLSFFYFP